MKSPFQPLRAAALLAALLPALLLAAPPAAAPAADAPAPPLTAESLMEAVRASMPGVPLDMQASIRALDPNGKPLSTTRARVRWTPRDSGRIVDYALLDDAGNTNELMSVVLSSAGSSFSYSSGDPLAPAPLPDLFAPVAASDISWTELSFAFFFWPNPRIVGRERVANRWDCCIVDVPRPPDFPAPWSHVRLWVAPAYSAIVRGEIWQEGFPVKRFVVQSIRRLRKVYMIGDLEVTDLADSSRSLLKISRMEMFADLTPEELEELNAPVVW